MLFLFNPTIEVSFQGCQTLTTVLGITLLAHLFIFDFVFFVCFLCTGEELQEKRRQGKTVSKFNQSAPTLHPSFQPLRSGSSGQDK